MRVRYDDKGLDELVDIIANAHVSGISDHRLNIVIDTAERLDTHLRDQEARKAADKAAERERARVAKDEAVEARIDALVEAGTDWVEARAIVTGRSMAAVRREEYRAAVGDHTTPFRDLVYREHLEAIEHDYMRAEQETRGQMVKTEHQAQVNPADFWYLTDKTALRAIRKYASDELIEWFIVNGRPTYEQRLHSIIHGGSDRVFHEFTLTY